MRGKPKTTLLPTQGIFNFPHHPGMVWVDGLWWRSKLYMAWKWIAAQLNVMAVTGSVTCHQGHQPTALTNGAISRSLVTSDMGNSRCGMRSLKLSCALMNWHCWRHLALMVLGRQALQSALTSDKKRHRSGIKVICGIEPQKSCQGYLHRWRIIRENADFPPLELARSRNCGKILEVTFQLSFLCLYYCLFLYVLVISNVIQERVLN